MSAIPNKMLTNKVACNDKNVKNSDLQPSWNAFTVLHEEFSFNSEQHESGKVLFPMIQSLGWSMPQHFNWKILTETYAITNRYYDEMRQLCNDERSRLSFYTGTEFVLFTPQHLFHFIFFLNFGFTLGSNDKCFKKQIIRLKGC